ncbi:MAG: hypothetical protein ACYTF0_02520 [Planctomycetota bacterium]|jgi:hypothetical protein
MSLGDLLTLIMLGGGLGLPLLFTVHAWQRRRRFCRLLEGESCRLCGCRFADALYRIDGRFSSRDLAGLDRIQRQYPGYRVLCQECHTINLCADNGVPMQAHPATEPVP